MHSAPRIVIAAASLILLASCASTGQNTSDSATQQQALPQQEAALQPGAPEQLGEEAQSYPYGQGPDNYDAYDASGGTASAAQSAPSVESIAPSSGTAQTVSADRIVYFDYDSANIRAQSRPVIEANSRNLMGNQQAVVQLEGHTDERGSREYNIALAERRANSVRQYMVGLGVPPQQIRVVSYGEERPVAAGQDEQSYAQNRRVEMVY